MATVEPTPIASPSLPLPDPADRATFGDRMREQLRWQREDAQPGFEILADQTYQNAQAAEDASVAANAAANFKGAWSALSGALNLPAAVYHDGGNWALLNDLADVTASEPGVSADWVEIGGVKRSGDTMTGPLEVPAGASGAQVPQAQEVAVLASTQLAGHRNRLINGNFAINQRGYVSGAATSGANQYTLDRWRVVTSGQNLTFSASGNGNQVTAPAGGIEQVIEGANIEGGTYVINWTGTATCTVDGTARAKGDSFTLTANTNVTVKFSGGTVSKAQLEPGTVPTVFEHRLNEFQLCQRYYEVLSTEWRLDASLGGATVSYGVFVGFSVAKRSTPAVSVVSETSSNASSATVTPKSDNGCFILFSWTNGTSVVVRTKTVNVAASAEL